MPYQQGPLSLQDEGNVGFAPTTYDFAGDTADQLSEVEAITNGWDSFLADAGVLLDGPSDPWPDVQLNLAIDALGVYADPPALLGVNAMVDALGVADLGLAGAIGYAPLEAWSDPSAPFVPPAPAEIILVPVIPPGAIDFSVTGTVATPAQVTVTSNPLVSVVDPGNVVGGGATAGSGTPLQGASAGLVNTSAYGSSNFTVGDGWTLTATGGPGELVYVYNTLNGQDMGGGNVGEIGGDRIFRISGQWRPEDAGVWQKQIFVGYNLEQTLNFIVLDQS